MSDQTTPLTYEGILELFRQTDRKFEELARQVKATSHEVGKLTSSVGRIIEHMVKGKIIRKFRALGYDVTSCSPNVEFDNEELGLFGEIDLLLNDGPISILIEVKTTLKTDDIREHIDRIGRYRRYVEAKGFGDPRRFIGAVAGAVVSKETAKFAHDNGMYVIVQSGDAIEIVASPDGFRAKEW